MGMMPILAGRVVADPLTVLLGIYAGEISLTAENLYAWSIALGVKVDDLYKGVDEQKFCYEITQRIIKGLADKMRVTLEDNDNAA